MYCLSPHSTIHSPINTVHFFGGGTTKEKSNQRVDKRKIWESWFCGGGWYLKNPEKDSSGRLVWGNLRSLVRLFISTIFGWRINQLLSWSFTLLLLSRSFCIDMLLCRLNLDYMTTMIHIYLISFSALAWYWFLYFDLLSCFCTIFDLVLAWSWFPSVYMMVR